MLTKLQKIEQIIIQIELGQFGNLVNPETAEINDIDLFDALMQIKHEIQK